MEYPPLVVSWMALPVRALGLAREGDEIRKSEGHAYIQFSRLERAPALPSTRPRGRNTRPNG